MHCWVMEIFYLFFSVQLKLTAGYVLLSLTFDHRQLPCRGEVIDANKQTPPGVDNYTPRRIGHNTLFIFYTNLEKSHNINWASVVLKTNTRVQIILHIQWYLYCTRRPLPAPPTVTLASCVPLPCRHPPWEAALIGWRPCHSDLWVISTKHTTEKKTSLSWERTEDHFINTNINILSVSTHGRHQPWTLTSKFKPSNQILPTLCQLYFH